MASHSEVANRPAALAVSAALVDRAVAVRAEVNNLLDRTQEAADSNHRPHSHRIRQGRRLLRVQADATEHREGGLAPTTRQVVVRQRRHATDRHGRVSAL